MSSERRGVLLVLASATRRGAETEAVALAGALVAAGHDVSVVALAGASAGTPLDVTVLGRNPLGCKTLLALRRVGRSRAVVVGYGSKSLPGCAIALFGLRTKFVYRNIGFPGDWLRGSVHRWRTRLLYKQVDHVVALWPGSAEAIQKLFGVEKVSVSVIPNARSAERFAPATAGERASARERFGLPFDQAVIGLVGALSVEKRPELALQSAMLVPEATLLIAGDGPLRVELEESARQFANRVRFIGSVEDVRPVYAAIDVLVLTSSTEGIPGVLIEASLCGVPCVTTDVGATAEVVSDGVSGRVVPVGSEPVAIAEALAAVLGNCAEFADAARHHVEETYSFDSVVPRWEEVLGEPQAARQRVLIVLASAARRGAEMQGTSLSGELLAAGFDARVVALAAGPEGGSLDVTVLGGKPLGWNALRALRREARASDVVIGYGSKSLPACALGLIGVRVPFVYRNIGFPGDWLRGRVHRWRTKMLYRRVDHVAALWPGSAAAIGELFDVERSRITVIPNARSAEKYSPVSFDERDATRRSFGLGIDDTVIGFVGALSGEKRVDLAIRAVSEMPGATLLIAGEGLRRLELEVLARELSVDARFLGSIDEVRSVYAACDVVLLTSATEGMPGVLIEAGLCGRPSVTTDVGAAGSVVEDGVTGRVLPPSATPADIAAALRDVLSMGNAGDAAADRMTARYSFESVVPLWQELLTQV